MPSVSIASGRVSVNAEPWAEVWIDDRNIGETPLAHVEVPAGEHEVVFRHPDFGERRQRVIVRADEVTRASTTFER
jgi:serine/threonine-protein kinase